MKDFCLVIMFLIMLGPSFAPNVFYKQGKEEYKLWPRVILFISSLLVIIFSFL